MITSEFGRRPKINAKGGRDHWGNLCPLVFVGVGLKMGQVIGESDKKGAEPITNPISSNDLLGTIMHSLFDLGQVRTLANIPLDVQYVVGSGNPISELILIGIKASAFLLYLKGFVPPPSQQLFCH